MVVSNGFNRIRRPYSIIREFGMHIWVGNRYGVPNGTKLRGSEVKRAACLPAKSAKITIKRHLAQPLR